MKLNEATTYYIIVVIDKDERFADDYQQAYFEDYQDALERLKTNPEMYLSENDKERGNFLGIQRCTIERVF